MMKTVTTAHLPFEVPEDVARIVEKAPSFTFADRVETLIELATRDALHGWHEVAYEVPGRGRVVEARSGPGLVGWGVRWA